jgi:membrane protease YdiL (CAAX protease family)
LATTNSTSFPLAIPQERSSSRDLIELVSGFLAIMLILWLPQPEQIIFGPIALLATLTVVLLRRPSLNQLGLGRRGFVASLWILPAAIALSGISVLVARSIGTLHPLSDPKLTHVGGYVVWTVYQQFLLQDYFMPRLTRVMSVNAAIVVAAALFAVAHLPNVWLALATLVWGAVSCALFQRYRNIYALGLAQGLLGLCFAICVPDALHHHMRVGLGYWQYHPEINAALGAR